MAYEFSKEGFEKHIKLDILPKIFEDALFFHNEGLCYNKLCLGDAAYSIDRPLYRFTEIDIMIGGPKNRFDIVVPNFGMEVESPFTLKKSGSVDGFDG